MKKLENSLGKIKPKKDEKLIAELKAPNKNKPLYNGLVLIEERTLMGGTGIKYWM